MLIEYKIKFEKDGLTISQNILPNSAHGVNRGRVPVTGLPATQQEVVAAAAHNPLAKGGSPGDPFGGSPGDPFGGSPGDPFGGGAPGSAPIFILGPIVFGNAAPENREYTEPSQSQARKPARAKARGAAAGRQE